MRTLKQAALWTLSWAGAKLQARRWIGRTKRHVPSIGGRLNQTDLLYIFDFFILSTWELSKYTTTDVSSRLCIFRSLFLLSSSSVQLQFIPPLFVLFCFHFAFLLQENQQSSQFWEWLQLYKIAPCCIQYQTNKRSKCDSVEPSPHLRGGWHWCRDVSLFKWHFGPLPDQWGWRVDSLSWPKVKETVYKQTQTDLALLLAFCWICAEIKLYSCKWCCMKNKRGYISGTLCTDYQKTLGWQFIM